MDNVVELFPKGGKPPRAAPPVVERPGLIPDPGYKTYSLENIFVGVLVAAFVDRDSNAAETLFNVCKAFYKQGSLRAPVPAFLAQRYVDILESEEALGKRRELHRLSLKA